MLKVLKVQGAETRLAVMAEREFFIDNLLVRIHCIIVMSRWTGLAPWEFEFSFAGSLTSRSMHSWYSCTHD